MCLDGQQFSLISAPHTVFLDSLGMSVLLGLVFFYGKTVWFRVEGELGFIVAGIHEINSQKLA